MARIRLAYIGGGSTRAQDILSWLPDYWRHYREQAEAEIPQLDPERSRGGIFELELAFDLMDAIYTASGEILPALQSTARSDAFLGAGDTP
ncbi:MAG: hypothetical protein OXC09_03475 [Truepera sp.]|nr:hypothetical protein [Truepera sp.]